MKFLSKVPALLVLTAVSLLASCASSNKAKKVGGQKDRHGCLVAAGYTWSELRKDCIRLWEEGPRLANVLDENATTCAYAVFNGDSSKVEIFLPSVTSHPILEKVGEGLWQSGSFSLRREEGLLCFYHKTRLIYK